MDNETTGQKSSNTTLIIVIILVVLASFVVFSSARKKSDTELMVKEENTMEKKTAPETDTSNGMEEKAKESSAMMKDQNVKEFVVTGSNFKFDITEMRVKAGDTVKIVFKNTDGFHDWVLDEFNAKTKQINDGQEDTIEFVADKAGSYEYYCSVGKHREMGMVGTFIVE